MKDHDIEHCKEECFDDKEGISISAKQKFTNEDLKRVKNGIKKLADYKDKNGRYAGMSFTWPELQGLLIHLEAAEKVVWWANFMIVNYSQVENGIPECKAMLKAWRKSCGRE